jgi:hypothetical protein
MSWVDKCRMQQKRKHETYETYLFRYLLDANSNGFNKRYVIYLNELQKLTLIHNNKEMAKLKKLRLVV